MCRVNPCFLTLLFILFSAATWCIAVERTEIPLQYTWKTDDLYPTLQAWEAAFDTVRSKVSRLETYQGALGKSGGINVVEFTQLNEQVDAEVSRIVWYAYYNYQVDMRDPVWTERRDRAFALWSEAYQPLTWVEPELLTIPEDTLMAWTVVHAPLKPYRQKYANMFALKAHSLSEPEERILALASDAVGGSYDTYTNLMTVDMDFPAIVDNNGDSITVSAAGWREVYRTHPNRQLREAYFQALYGRYRDFSNTCATTLANKFRGDVFYAKARSFNDCLEANLSPSYIPTEIYYNLIQSARANTAPLQKYMTIRKRVLGGEHYCMWDEYVPLGNANNDARLTWDQAAQAVVEAVKPLGNEYVQEGRFVLDPANRLVDPFTSTGKIGGAWSHNSLCEPARMLFNFDYAGGLTAENIITIAHETGHTLHANYTMRNQPVPLREDISLVAEVPSTANEALFQISLLDAARNDFREATGAKKEAARQQLIYLIDRILSKGASGFYRQIMFAEWELEAHRLAERGEPMTNESLTQLFSQLLQDYYGSALEADELTEHMWASVPHFYLGFYTYSYAVGEVAANALASDITAEFHGDRSKRGTTERYLQFLKSGSSKHPAELLKEAGVDLTTASPIETYTRNYSKLVDELDALVKQ